MKNTVPHGSDHRRLAVCGGQQRFATPRHVGTSPIPDRETLHKQLDQMLDAHGLTNDGPFVKDFEFRLSRPNGDVEAVVVRNTTVGMQLLIKGLIVEQLGRCDLQEFGDEAKAR